MIIGQYLFMIFAGMVASWFLIVTPYILLMHFLMPPIILDKYFRPPYFGEFERSMFTGIPYAPMRTIMFMGVIAYPKMGKKRKLTEVYRDTPRWYRIASKAFIYQLIIIGGGGIGLLCIMLLMMSYDKLIAS